MAHILAGDNNLPSSFEKEISSQIKRQINSYKKFNKMDEKEIIKTIKIDILIGDLEYKDQFEWDIANPDNDELGRRFDRENLPKRVRYKKNEV